jgi:hypothetical protein
MNKDQLAAQIEADFPVKVGRDKDGNPATWQITPGGELDIIGMNRFKFIVVAEYGGGLRDNFDVYFSVMNGDPDTCMLMGQGLNALTNAASMALDAADKAVPALSTETIKAVVVAVDRREIVKPIAEVLP